MDLTKRLNLYISNVQWHLDHNGGYMTDEAIETCHQRIRDWEETLYWLKLGI